MAEDAIAMAKALDEDFQDLWARMDDEAEVLKGEEYSLPDTTNPAKPFSNAVNITRNTPLVMASYAMSKVIAVDPQWTVEGRQLSDDTTSLVEQYCADWLDTMQALVACKQVPGVLFALGQQALFRGRICGVIEIIPQRPKVRNPFARRKASPSVKLCDSRYCSYRVDGDGIELFKVKYSRTKEQIESEYKIDTTAKKSDVELMWNRETYWLIIGGKVEKTDKNPFQEVPAVVSLVGKGFFFDDEDIEEYRGQSILTNNIKTWDSANRIASINATILNRVLSPTTIHESDNDQIKAVQGNVSAPGQHFDLAKGEDLRTVQLQDLNRAGVTLLQTMETDEQTGGYSVVQHGIGPAGKTATEIKSDLQSEGQVHGPALVAMQEWLQQATYMSIRQIVKQKLTVSLGAIGFEQDYRHTELKGAYRIKCELQTVDPMEDIANLTIGAELSQTKLYSMDTIRRQIVKMKNPEDEERKIQDEELEQRDPITKQIRVVMALIGERKKFSGLQADIKDLESRRALQMCLDMISKEGMMQSMAQQPQPKGIAPLGNPMKGGGMGVKSQLPGGNLGKIS